MDIGRVAESEKFARAIKAAMCKLPGVAGFADAL